MNKLDLVAITLIAALLVTSILVWPSMPGTIATHWNAAGKVDGWTDKASGLFIMPAMALAVFALMWFLPKVDPLQKNIRAMQAQLGQFRLGLTAFFVYLGAAMLAFNLGWGFDFTTALAPGFALLFYTIGELCENSRRNWFFGIRTPWALSSDRNWAKTNKLAGTLFKAAAVVSVVTCIFTPVWILAVVGLAIAAAVASTVISYMEYREESKGGNQRRTFRTSRKSRRT